MPVFHNACFLIYVLKSLEGIVKYKKRSGETSQKIFAGIQEREDGEITQWLWEMVKLFGTYFEGSMKRNA